MNCGYCKDCKCWTFHSSRGEFRWGWCVSRPVSEMVEAVDAAYGADFTRQDFGCIFWEGK